jgi:tetratricopeptide (TPR) repeat protein
VSAYIQNKLFDEALAGLKKAVQERGDDPLLIHDMGLVYAARGDRANALRMIKELEEMPGVSWNHWKIAKIYSALNEKDLALTWLERGMAAKTITFFLKDDPVWDPIRDDPRFADIIRRMGFLS